MEKKPSRPSKQPRVAESPLADVFENRHPSDAEKKWAEKTLAPTLEKSPERPIGAPTGVNLDEHGHARFTTISGVPIRRLYTQADLPEDWSEENYLGYPGQPPYTRGIHATGYRGKLYTMRQFSGFASPEETNQRYKYLLEHGGSGLSVAFDLPTLMGYDSDHPASEGEVGKCGVAIDSLEDMEILFGGIDLEKTTVSMTINSPASVLWAMYLVVAEKQGADWKKISGTIQNDILKEYIARGTYIYPPRPAMRIITDLFAWAAREMPEWNTISISGYHIREAGSTAIQEVAFTFADAIAYIESALAAGLSIDAFAPRLSFFFNAHSNFLEEIAKFRAARRLYAKLMRDRFGAKDKRSQMLRFHTQTAGSTLTAQQPDVNVVRTTLEALSAVLGGTQSLHTNARDEALSLPTEQSAQLALRTQQIIAYESGVADVPDPLGGSYYIESLTDEIERGAVAYLDRIEAMGGTLRAIETGYIQGEVQNAAYAFQRAVEKGDRIIVGVNRFQMEQGAAVPTFRLDPALERTQIARLREVRASRSKAAVDSALARITLAARGSANLMPLILEAAENYATVGEISGALKDVFGEYTEGT
jgi:methylmalonyl-CoA mutase N-terminal domain/subunit